MGMRPWARRGGRLIRNPLPVRLAARRNVLRAILRRRRLANRFGPIFRNLGYRRRYIHAAAA